MKNLFIIGILLCFLLVACSKSDDNKSEETGGCVVGTVFDSSTGNPIVGVNVCIGYRNPGGQYVSISSYVTGSDGMYSFENVPPFSKTHFATINVVWVQEGNSVIASRGVSVTAGHTTTADISY